MKIVTKISLCLLIPIIIYSCTTGSENTDLNRSLPFLGFKDIDVTVQNGVEITDTIYHTIGSFYFTAHNGEAITNKSVTGKVYVADFFFTHCPSICPVMTNNLKNLHENTKDLNEFMIISHTIDPARDTLGRLNEYIKMMEINPRDNWYFVRGSSKYTYEIGKDEYLINAEVDREAEGGFLHSEHFVLVDKEGHIRGMYEGTDTAQVNQLERDARFLISTYHND